MSRPPGTSSPTASPSGGGDCDDGTLDGVIGASAALFDDAGRVLLIERGKPPFAGVWSLPGGHIEPGEAPAATAVREVAEETGVTAEDLAFLTRYDVPLRDETGAIRGTLPLAVYFGRAAAGASPVAADDVRAARFVAIADLAGYPLTENCAELVGMAAARLTR